ncbi:TPA: phosphohydrolase, partial [Enterococcus faecalis]|nr:phosphohydrolase [Enterococcus faecalis]HAP5615983.1 phosphohydrolase [Enterococcus faecalis]
LNAFYFMPKVFKAIAAFSEKIQRRPIVLLNNQEWPVPKPKNPSTVH